MIFTDTPLAGAYIIAPERLEDERGFFARTWCQREFEAHGLNWSLAQCNISYNKVKGTLRGMHFQAAPYQEAKLVRCTMGAIYDVIIDLRPESPTFVKHFGATLTPQTRTMLYIPEGFAHGFLTMADDTEVFYQMSEFYAPDYGRGVRWNDPAFDIEWPAEVAVISERDAGYADFASPGEVVGNG
jgi:dTDP-4-dehydrorhamnose 3,5-epimerase